MPGAVPEFVAKRESEFYFPTALLLKLDIAFEPEAAMRPLLIVVHQVALDLFPGDIWSVEVVHVKYNRGYPLGCGSNSKMRRSPIFFLSVHF